MKTMEMVTFQNVLTRLCCCGYLSIIISVIVSDAAPMNQTQILQYFLNGNYIGENNPDPEIAAITDPAQQMKSATETFQRLWGFTVTGELTAEQLEVMSQPRCSVPDIQRREDMKRRKKRFTAFSKWEHNEITYKISIYPRDRDLNEREVDDAIHRAFNIWAAVTPLTFTRRDSRDKADIDIQFGSYHHGDYYPFDGPNGFLAHAFFPPYGQTHFDDSEVWTLDSTYYNLYTVAVHEFGHSLGLGHNMMRRSAIMYPNYQYFDPVILDYDDILGIQTLYGSRAQDPEWPQDRPDLEPTTPSTTTKKTYPDQPHEPSVTDIVPVRPTKRPTIPPHSTSLAKICHKPRLDAMTYIQDLEDDSLSGTYGFQGRYYFKIGDHGYVDEAYPRLISEDWPGIPDDIDAALFWEANRYIREPSMTLIFKRDRYWAVQGKRIMPGYPKPITVLGIPNDIDSAFVWNYNGKTYFFKDFYYYRYTRGIGPDQGFPRRIAKNWEGIPDGVDAIFKWDNMQTYFFKDNLYWRYDDSKGQIAESYPRPFDTVWLKCSRVKDQGIYGIDNDDNNIDNNAVSSRESQIGHGHKSSLDISLIILTLSYLIVAICGRFNL